MLKRVSIQNFKSLKDVTLDLQKINLLIGPNNSGKTNFLKALEMFSFNGYIFQNVNELKTVSYMHQEIPIEYQFIFDSNGKKGDTIKKNIGRNANTYNYKQVYKIMVTDASKQVGSSMEDWLTDNAGNKLYDSVSSEDRRMFAEYIRTKAYRPDPNKFTEPGPVGAGEEAVSTNASNLVGFLDLMLGKYRKSVFGRIEKDINACIPEFNEINLEDAKATEDLIRFHGEESRKRSFKRIGLTDSRQNTIYWADELSEGTLYFLALLCIVNQPNPPKLLLLEEPEKGIHPRRIREVMDFIFRLAEEKDIQIILTTHNENVLNEFTSMYEAVFVFEKDEEGATHVKNLQRDIIEPSNQRSRETGTKEIDFTSNLGESWMYGLLGGVPVENL